MKPGFKCAEENECQPAAIKKCLCLLLQESAQGQCTHKRETKGFGRDVPGGEPNLLTWLVVQGRDPAVVSQMPAAVRGAQGGCIRVLPNPPALA